MQYIGCNEFDRTDILYSCHKLIIDRVLLFGKILQIYYFGVFQYTLLVCAYKNSSKSDQYNILLL